MVVKAIALMLAWVLVHCDAAKDDLVCCLLVVWPVVLALNHDVVLLELLYDFLHRVLQDSLEGENLLGHETILLEVAINHLPAVVLVDGVHVGPDGCIAIVHFQPMP